MMNNLDKYITQAEHKWLKPLYNYCQSLFKNTQIPSHDHTHHFRVWEYSKEILNELEQFYLIDSQLVEASIISSFFHDAGLTKTLNENHGKESKKICIEYFADNKLQKPENWEEILFSLENHDDKDYKMSDTDPLSVLSIVCTADDMDAFGNIGVVRYTEIYLLRGITLTELPELVINNLDKRFSNFEKSYGNFSRLYNKHKKRYLITKDFFENTTNELNNSLLSS